MSSSLGGEEDAKLMSPRKRSQFPPLQLRRNVSPVMAEVSWLFPMDDIHPGCCMRRPFCPWPFTKLATKDIVSLGGAPGQNDICGDILDGRWCRTEQGQAGVGGGMQPFSLGVREMVNVKMTDPLCRKVMGDMDDTMLQRQRKDRNFLA